MSADDLLAQPLPIDVDHLLAEHHAACTELRRLRTGITVDQQIRATALDAAATWLAGIDPYPQGRHTVLDAAEVFAHWITTGDQPHA